MQNYLKKELYQLIKNDELVLDFIQKGATDGFLFLNVENNDELWMSPRLWEIIGYKQAPERWKEVVYLDDLDKLMQAIKSSEKHPLVSFMIDLRFKHSDGHCVTIQSRSYLVQNEQGKTNRLLGAMHILAASTESQLHTFSQIKQLQESEEKYKAMYNNAPLAFQSLDIDGNIVDVNPQWLKILQYKEDEVVGHWFGDFLHPEYVDYFLENFPQFKKQGFISNVQFKMRKQNGEFIDVAYEGCISYTAEGHFRQTYCTFKDISKEKEAHSRLRESEEKLRLAIDNSPLGVCVLDRKGAFVSVNKAFKRIVGYTSEELSSMTFYDITHPDYLLKNQDFFDEIINNKSNSFSIDKQYIRKDGVAVDVRLHLGAIGDSSFNTSYAMTFVEDITWQKKFQRELIKAKEKAEDSNRLKSEFLHNMSHEIRTPMNGIVGFSEMLAESELSAEKRRYFTTIIKNSSHQLLHIIDDILDISILETKQVRLNKTKLCVNDFVLDLFSIYDIKAKEQGIPIYLKNGLGDNDIYITTDVSKLHKILSNLLENALKFTSEGFVELSYYKKNNHLKFDVKDTGIGILPQNIDRIFQRFSQESKDIAHSHGGLGLGLSIAKENAQLLEGDISVSSQKGEGATFHVTIPFLPEDITHQKATTQKVEMRRALKGKNTILVAEDEEINMLYLETVLEEMEDLDLEILHAKNGKEAVDMCLENPHIRLILMDIKMPIMNGYEAALSIKSTYPDLPIIAETAYSTESDNDYALTHGCDEFISKPIDRKALYLLIRKYLK